MAIQQSTMVYITRRERFSAAHKLSQEAWSNEKNKEIFGKCANPNWHGHNYTLWVTVKGKPHPDTGFVINLSDLSEILKKHVIEKVDHKNMNLDVDFMEGQLTSTENIAIAIWKQIEAPIQALGAQLDLVKLQETENNYVEYRGE